MVHLPFFSDARDLLSLENIHKPCESHAFQWSLLPLAHQVLLWLQSLGGGRKRDQLWWDSGRNRSREVKGGDSVRCDGQEHMESIYLWHSWLHLPKYSGWLSGIPEAAGKPRSDHCSLCDSCPRLPSAPHRG